jgi:hypothetical protein
MFDKKLSNELTSNFLWIWRELLLKCSICCMRRMEKISCVWMAQGYFRRKRWCGTWRTTWSSGNDENWWSVGKVRSLVTTNHRVSIRMIEVDFNMDKEIVRHILTTHLNVKQFVSKWPQWIRQFLAGKQISALKHAPYSPELAPSGFFIFPEIEKFSQRSPFSLNWRHPWENGWVT